MYEDDDLMAIEDFGPKVQLAFDEIKSLLHVTKEMMVSLRLHDVNATNIAFVAKMICERAGE